MNPHHLTNAFSEQYKFEDVDIVYICAGLDKYNESYSIKAHEIFGSDKKIIRFFTKDVISDTQSAPLKNIFTIDLFSMVAKDEQIRNSDLDRKALAIHNKWLIPDIKSYVENVEKQISSKTIKNISRPKPTLAPWHLLNEDSRDDNRSVVDHFYIKIRTTNQLTKDENFDKPENPDKNIFRNTKQILKDKDLKKPDIDFYFIDKNDPKYDDLLFTQLAEMEHRRWMANKYYYGWRFGQERNDEKKVHPYLVEFDLLEPEIQKKDFDQILQMKEIW